MGRYFVPVMAIAMVMSLAQGSLHCGVWAQDNKPKAERLSITEVLTQRTEYVRSVSFSPDGKTLAVALDPRDVSVWDVKSGKEIHRFLAAGKVGTLAWEPKGRRLVAAVYDGKVNEKKIHCWDVETGHQIFSVDMKAIIPSLAYHPDGAEFAMAGYGGKIDFRDAENGALLRSIPQRSIHDIAFAPDGKTMASASSDKTIKITDFKSGDLLFSLVGHKAGVRDICFGDAGNLIASVGRDKCAIVWDTKTGDLRCTIRFPYSAHTVALSPNGKWVVIGGDVPDGRITLHDAATGREVLELAKVRSGTTGLAFNRDGTLLAASWGSHLRVWEIKEAKMPAEKGK